MANLTAADAEILISVSGVFSTPFQIQGFSADNVYDNPEVELAQTAMGVDGRLSAGMVFNPIDQNFSIQADSLETISFFDTWSQRQLTNKTVYVATGSTLLRGVETRYVMRRGFLITANQMPSAARILQPRRFLIRWEGIVPSPNL